MISTQRKRQFEQTNPTCNSDDGYLSTNSKNSSSHSLDDEKSRKSDKSHENSSSTSTSTRNSHRSSDSENSIGNEVVNCCIEIDLNKTIYNISLNDEIHTDNANIDLNHNQQRTLAVKVSRKIKLINNDSRHQKQHPKNKNFSMQAIQPTKISSKNEHHQQSSSHQNWPEPPCIIQTVLTQPNPNTPRPFDPKQPFYDQQVHHFNETYAIEQKTCKSTSGYIWMGNRRIDNLPVVAKQIPKQKVHRFGRIEGFPHKVPYEFVALHRVQKYAKNSQSCKNVVKLLDFYERRSSYVMVMEQLQNGMDLLDYSESKNNV